MPTERGASGGAPGIDRLIDRVERERGVAREMERYLQQLLDGPLQGEIERRFGPARGGDERERHLGWKRIMSKAWPVDDVDPEAPVIDNARRVLAVESLSSIPLSRSSRIRNSPRHCMTCGSQQASSLHPRAFRPQFRKAGERQIERVKAIQEILGTLHDHDVRIDMIGDELSQLMVEQSGKTRSEIADASPDELAAIATAALRPPPDDPRRGLIALLGREHAGRRTACRFRELWDEYAANGMRRDLVALSVTPLHDRRGVQAQNQQREWCGAKS